MSSKSGITGIFYLSDEFSKAMVKNMEIRLDFVDEV